MFIGLFAFVRYVCVYFWAEHLNQGVLPLGLLFLTQQYVSQFDLFREVGVLVHVQPVLMLFDAY